MSSLVSAPITDLQPHLNEPPLSADEPSTPAEPAAAGPELLRSSGDARVRRYASNFADLMEMRAPRAVVGA